MSNSFLSAFHDELNKDANIIFDKDIGENLLFIDGKYICNIDSAEEPAILLKKFDKEMYNTKKDNFFDKVHPY